MIKPEDCTIIIPHLGKSEESKYALGQCLESLISTVPGMKIIVAVNGVEDFSYWGDEVYEKHGNVDYMLIGKQGQCVGVNAAVATTNTPWIFVTNDDMIFSEGWFERLTTGIFQPLNTKVMCISPKLVEPRPGAPTFIVEPLGGAGGDFDKDKWIMFANEYYGKKNSEMKFDVRNGFNLPFLIYRELWDTIGGYDINYDPWGSNSDSDLEYKIKLSGIQPIQNEMSIVYHFSQTSGTFEPRNDEYRFKNYEYFKSKWGFDRTDDGIWEASFTIPTVEEGRIYNPVWAGKYGGLS